jgi:hypothetical protein
LDPWCCMAWSSCHCEGCIRPSHVRRVIIPNFTCQCVTNSRMGVV